MTTLVEIGLSNLLVAGLLAVVAVTAGRWGKRPALTHGLWVLVFLKLITPPFVVIPLGFAQPSPLEETATLLMPDDAFGFAEVPDSGRLRSRVSELDWDEPIVDEDVAAGWPWPVAEADVAPSTPHWTSKFPWLAAAAWCWIVSSIVWFGWAGIRLWRFRRTLKGAWVAPNEVQEETARLAQVLGITPPSVLVVGEAMSPALFVVGRGPIILVPRGLLGRLTPEQRTTLLAHELAHLRRRDHWVRCLELIVLGLYWWCPLVWWARAELREAEEECCDAWVVWALPGAARAYAYALVETVDFLAGAPPRLPQLASGFGPVQRLKRRLTMILRGTAPRTLTLAGGALVIALGMVLLPLMPSWSQEPQRQREQERKKEIERKKERPGDEGGERDRGAEQERLAKMQAELQRARAQLQAQQAELERKAMELQRALEESRRGPGAGDGRKPVPQPPGPGQPGRGFGGKGPGGFGPPMDIERRLREMERKLESLLDEMSALRRDLGKGPGFGGFPGQPRPKERPDSPEQPKTPRRPGEGGFAPPGAPAGPGVGPGFVPRRDEGAAGAPNRPRDPNPKEIRK